MHAFMTAKLTAGVGTAASAVQLRTPNIWGREKRSSARAALQVMICSAVALRCNCARSAAVHKEQAKTGEAP